MDVHGRHLRYFVAVAEDLHFSRAAERIFVSQPALSKQIRLLERQLGTELFVRNRREVQLTPAGAVLLPVARRLLAEWDNVWADVQQVITDEAQNLSIGMSTSPGRGGLLPAIRSRFRSELPNVRLTVRQVGWDDPTAGLADKTSDVAFVWLPLPGPDRYRSVTVASEPCVVAMPVTHPLATRTTLRVADLEHEPLLALPGAAGPLRDHWLLTDFRSSPALIGAEVSTAEETYEALVDGCGVVVLAHGNQPLLARDGVTMRPLKDGPRGELALAWRKDDARPTVAHYARACRQVIGARVRSAGITES
ncbi:LysR family transcriptional regulator [Paenarthrobacter nicotinovorans]|uniref:LysR family transcriptional regulator n=1 Tax=Paenarthrobacter nicotinovorans TaxID=29320 RepID=UPI0011A5964A|nr:LysR substrate-binding domain-containing protein [Paenarthrobacter nicotinovorans]